MLKKLILFSFICFIQSVQSYEVLGAFQSAKPPFILPEEPYSKKDLAKDTKGLGIQIDIARAALKVKGHSLKHVFVNEQRLNNELKLGSLDIAFDVRPSFQNRFYSKKNFSKYENAFISLKSKNLNVNEFKDLSDISFTAWQGASKDLGVNYANAVKNNRYYYEKTNTSKLKMFLTQRVDGILIDENIFKWYYKEVYKGKDGLQIFEFHKLKELSPRGGKAGFVSESLRDDFDHGMKVIQKSGEYQKIVESYFQ